MEALAKSFSELSSNLLVMRVFKEEAAVEGCGYFHRNPKQPLHVLGNIVRVFTILTMAPIYILIPRILKQKFSNYVGAGWLVEFATTPDPVLTHALDGGMGEYAVTGYNPTWVLSVKIVNGRLDSFSQTEFKKNPVGYTALSYDIDSVALLFPENERPIRAPRGKPPYNHPDRRKIAKKYLELYCSAKREEGNPNRTERIWLDEFCIQPQSQWEAPEKVVRPVRQQELGKLADIFSKADQVAVFCSQMECDHTGIDCSWGQRLFTFAEILHAQHVLRLTIVREEKEFVVRLIHHAAHIFREAMQTNAALAKRWHLYAVYQHSVNAGAVPWQLAIHALVVEAIRRDEITEFPDHELLGKALNGLLPRRARLQDLASSGWNDLGWLLELNQGFYNAASLAAVCSIPDDRSVSWLGKPIHPAVGNERLEPLVTAFPVSGYFTAVWKKKEKTSPATVPEKPDSKPRVPNPPLTILAQKTIGLRPTPLKRDKDGLYTNEEMKGLKILAQCVVLIIMIISLYCLAAVSPNVGIGLYWLTSVLYCILELLVGTMYLERDGWAWIEDADWSANLERSLGKQDSHLRSLVHWGDQQLIPKWEPPPRRESFSAKLVDLRNKVYTEVIAVARPNAMIPLAVHGSGVTCMLLYRPWDHEDAPSFTGTKVGMCNIPPYALAQTIKTGTVCVTSDAEADLKEVIFIQLCLSSA
ncbi:hypothetical protein C8F04DRAFT_1116152 [Mycena alexandri]|uniref:Heterokaryon incompatibility domain-containing protein n=1 Tax=Mycena alexandri TaxID=1745969 RepID=A0AAD6SNH2_9AGAR|nr:hypothetical protein C8F04DRAFT_1116152 [Mycena alexandri]